MCDMETGKLQGCLRNGHEMAPLNTRARDGTHGVTIVLTAPQRNSITSAEVDADPDRAAWSGKLQFFLSIIGYSVGLGNIWRFPYLCQKNGGGAFLIPFFTMLILEGIPLFLIELGIGQKLRLGSLGVWNTIHPWAGGVGISSLIVTLYVALYYNVIITWCFYYLFNSLRFTLPWQSCPTVTDSFGNVTEVAECAKSSETAYFWYRETLDITSDMNDFGGIKWWIAACLLLSWTVVFLIMMKGIQSSGKVVYFTSLFPYVVLTIFFIQGMTLKGAGTGLMHMYTPDMQKLFEPKVWLEAATQVFYSFGLAFGSLIAFGSYNQPKNNCVRDVVLVSVCNALTAIYASVVIFAILGYKASVSVERCVFNNLNTLYAEKLSPMDPLKIPTYEAQADHLDKILKTQSNETLAKLDLPICSLADQLNAVEGTGLAFMVFTEAVAQLPAAPFWSIIFFLMLLSLGIGSQIGILEGLICTLFDIDILKRFKKQHITATLCICCFLIGLVFSTGAGEYWLNLFDSFAATITLLIVALMEMVIVIYVYGLDKFCNDIYGMTNYRPGAYWRIMWGYVGPILMITILVASIREMCLQYPQYTAWHGDVARSIKTDLPEWALILAIVMIVSSIIPMPIVFLLRRFQLLKMDLDIHQGSIRRNETTTSTKEMMDEDDMMSPDDAPQESLAATRFTIGDFDNDDVCDGTAIGGQISNRSDSDEDDNPPTFRNHSNNNTNGLKQYLPLSLRKSFHMEVIEY